MKESELRKGMSVRIETSVHTKKTFTVNPEMEHLIKGVHKIKDVQKYTDYGTAAVIGDFWWNPKDLVSLEKPLPPKKTKIVNFDIKELVL